jgi:hypothetical protein
VAGNFLFLLDEPGLGEEGFLPHMSAAVKVAAAEPHLVASVHHA